MANPLIILPTKKMALGLDAPLETTSTVMPMKRRR
jgi:hypothetical protein